MLETLSLSIIISHKNRSWTRCHTFVSERDTWWRVRTTRRQKYNQIIIVPLLWNTSDCRPARTNVECECGSAAAAAATSSASHPPRYYHPPVTTLSLSLSPKGAWRKEPALRFPRAHMGSKLYLAQGVKESERFYCGVLELELNGFIGRAVRKGRDGRKSWQKKKKRRRMWLHACGPCCSHHGLKRRLYLHGRYKTLVAGMLKVFKRSTVSTACSGNTRSACMLHHDICVLQKCKLLLFLFKYFWTQNSFNNKLHVRPPSFPLHWCLVGKLHLAGCRPYLHFITCWKWYFIVRSVLGTELLRGSHELLPAWYKSVPLFSIPSLGKLYHLEFSLKLNITHEPFDLTSTSLPAISLWIMEISMTLNETIIIFILPHFFFIGLYAKAELNSLCRFTFESRLVSPAGTKVSAAHGATCLGLPLLRRMFGVFFARGNERSSSWRHLCRARAAHTVLRGSTRPPHGTRLDLSPRRRLLIHTAWKWGWRVWGEGSSSGIFCCPVCGCRSCVTLIRQLKVNFFRRFFLIFFMVSI